MITTFLHQPKRQHGFTIVELLIVIVVIGILAAITIVAFNGVQQKAKNTQVLSGVNSYYKGLSQYAISEGSYPNVNTCLGAGYPDDTCWMGDSGTFYSNATVHNDLLPYLSPHPVLATARFSIGVGNNTRAGVLYLPTPAPRLIYYLQGVNQSCSLTGSTSTNEGSVVTQCRVNLPPI